MTTERSVLLVDDDRDLVLGTSLRLNASGYRTDIAHNGREGLQKARDGLPGAIVLDMRMPGMDGLEILHELRRDGRTCGIPVVMLSASLIHREAALNAGAEFFVTKPYDSAHLVTALKKAMERDSHA